ncbi:MULTISPECIES: hypothetical protein [unclassified Acidovorax]|uniref:hypothetical protein n=1 Tax=unclassified Acidovorax TaxID=2684926 RepID=UPI001C4595E5|nr:MULTISPECIES: hypothetical protein [unclassified Acidovorax]MBV7458288.1 hypothetical protein [Acidovorax sp. sif0632]MBV7463890.1 hypothetical protein [Acidovorax sp. sif0613]
MINFQRHPAPVANSGLPCLYRALLLAAPLVLAACGGGSGESEPAGLPAPSGFSVASYGPKTYNLGWTVTPGAMRYELFEDPDGAAGPQPESLFGVGAANNVTSFPIQVGGLLHERVNASYRLRACDTSGCGPFTSAVTPDLTQAIGRFDLPAGDPKQRFGAYTNAIALSADGLTLAVGSPREGSSDGLAGAGAVYIFSRSMPGVGMPAPAWGLRARLEGSSPAAKMAFGASLALSANGRTLAVGAPEERSNARGINGDAANRDAYGAGAAYIFMDNGSTWSQQAYIKSRNTPAKVETCSRLDISGTAVFPCTPQHFGFSVALSADGNLLAVGAPEEGANFTPGSAAVLSGLSFTGETIFGGGVGAVHTFARNNGGWAEQAHLPGSSADPTMARFGAVVALSSDGTVLAANTDKDISVLTHLGGVWSAPTQVWRVPAAGALTGSHNPFAMSRDGSTLAVLDRSGGTDVQLRTFTRTGDAWTQQPALPVKAADGFFTNSVMLSLSADGRMLAVGNLDDASNASGINGNPNNQALYSAGAVNVYRRDGTTWAHRAYLKAPQPRALARFGASVALSGDASTLAVGTSSATDGVTPAAADAAYLY